MSSYASIISSYLRETDPKRHLPFENRSVLIINVRENLVINGVRKILQNSQYVSNFFENDREGRKIFKVILNNKNSPDFFKRYHAVTIDYKKTIRILADFE